jgi:hypothetical protein
MLVIIHTQLTNENLGICEQLTMTTLASPYDYHDAVIYLHTRNQAM